MSKAVLISIHPKWCEKIALCQKTIEVRKTRPKIETPFKCYIYCTKDKPIMGRNLWLNDDGSVRYNAFEKCEEEDFDRYNQDHLFRANGTVIGEFICDRIIEASSGEYYIFLPKRLTALYPHELSDYADGKTLYGWHISDLLIYDKPKDIRRFAIVDKEAVKMCPHRVRVGQSEAVTKHNGWIKGGYGCEREYAWEVAYEYCDSCRWKPLNRPPQSWCYVEKLT